MRNCSAQKQNQRVSFISHSHLNVSISFFFWNQYKRKYNCIIQISSPWQVQCCLLVLDKRVLWWCKGRHICLIHTPTNIKWLKFLWIYFSLKNCGSRIVMQKNTFHTNFESHQNHKVYQNNHSIILPPGIKCWLHSVGEKGKLFWVALKLIQVKMLANNMVNWLM